LDRFGINFWDLGSAHHIQYLKTGFLVDDVQFTPTGIMVATENLGSKTVIHFMRTGDEN
jgi:hypothetical protein